MEETRGGEFDLLTRLKVPPVAGRKEDHVQVYAPLLPDQSQTHGDVPIDRGKVQHGPSPIVRVHTNTTLGGNVATNRLFALKRTVASSSSVLP